MKQAKRPKVRKGAWFMRVRGSYLPASWRGWLTYIPYVAYLIGAMVILDHYLGGSKWLLIAILYLPSAVAAAAVMNWIAINKS